MESIYNACSDEPFIATRIRDDVVKQVTHNNQKNVLQGYDSEDIRVSVPQSSYTTIHLGFHKPDRRNPDLDVSQPDICAGLQKLRRCPNSTVPKRRPNMQGPRAHGLISRFQPDV